MIAAMGALELAQSPPPAPAVESHEAETATEGVNETISTANITAASGAAVSSSEATKPTVRKKGKAKLTVKEKKERALFVERIVNVLPLEFRGSDPNLRRQIELVVEGFLEREGRGIGIMELVKPPDLTQARVNKCLIALVNRKIVHKDNSTGAVLYHWRGLPA
ncbi:hypothetical protein NM688_g1567 [Phlebia brevispora]|uniref:Uncharacterized protein n=1 Tax=Phlebia brevispora TaxID=194682 RepID=A0ACC1TBF7_9APHY|nr:hypothetical protein NM688_g1567 [Phlebia brevispora]